MHPSRVPQASYRVQASVDVLKLFGTPTLTLAGARRHETLQWQSHTALVALLACAPGWHSRESLAEIVRPEATPSVARAYLRRLLHRVRSLLPQMTGLEVEATRVRWSGESDVAAFDRAVARKDWQAAVALQRSPFLQGVGTTGQAALDDWFHETRVRLAGSLQVALLALMTQLYRSPDVDLSEPMQQLAENSPLDENCIQFLLLHARTPLEKHAATTAFHAFERRAQQELGASPRPETLALFRELQGRIAFSQATHPRADRGGGPMPVADDLPEYDDQPFLGRQRELGMLGDLLAGGRARLLAIHGLGGIGKTRLARQLYDVAAADASAHALWIRLEHLPPQNDLSSLIAARLGMPRPERDAEAQLAARLAGQNMMLFLDGFERHVAHATELVRLVDRVRDFRCVITTREATRLPHEHLISLVGLDAKGPDSDASRLFQRHARKVGYSSTDADAPSVAELVSHLEGHPLAIELAAAWAPLLPVRSILLELKRDLRFIDAPTSRSSSGRKDMREIFESEWDRLDLGEQTALQLLARHEGGIDSTVARAAAGMGGPGVLLRLANKSLLRRGADGRLLLHPLLRQFAASKGQAAAGAEGPP